MRRPLVLVILDGWGVRSERDYNAVALARTPSFAELTERFPMTTLEASGERVGLPPGQMGNSEVGHTNMGAGRVVYQDLTRIDLAIRDGSFANNEALVAAIDEVQRRQKPLHVIGLLSDGGVHSHIAHLEALLAIAKPRGVNDVYVHAFTDGRDTSPRGGVDYVGRLESTMQKIGVGRVASVSGRYYAMDRDKRWERTQRALDAMVSGHGETATSAADVLEQSYRQDVTDEFVVPTVIVDAHGAPIGRIADGDVVVCFNFRADRVRQITRGLTHTAVTELPPPPRDVHYTCFTQYDATFDLPVAFPPQEMRKHFGEILGNYSIPNLRLAETEKYAHVTYFFNCGIEQPYPREDRLLIPSPKVATYDLQPAMSARGITASLLQDLGDAAHDVVICNFANADMVGHTGSLEATVAAVETLDQCLGEIAAAVLSRDGTLIVTADHGNCEQMWDAERGLPHTAHTANPVPFLVARAGASPELRSGGALCDVAPTMLQLLGLDQPREMTGQSLFT
jgi:2,3-bisphosphoglycerate-independent phosphoglycerate mutase